MGRYGIPYQGSKSGIAEDIIDFLPRGKRLVDLFGGGGAISHCASLSGKWEEVLWQDINPLLEPFLRDCISGKYNLDTFKPKFITRDEFFEKKDTDGYIAYIWSFGNNGIDYLYGKHLAHYKEICHSAVVFNEITDEFRNIFPSFIEWDNLSITKRRLALRELVRVEKKHLSRGEKEKYSQLQHLEALERLQNLENTRVTLKTDPYLNYKYEDGDIVYLDPPYENTRNNYLNKVFNQKEFYDWCYNADFPIYFSSYDISDKRFECVWQRNKRVTFGAITNNLVTEKIYCNKLGKLELEKIIKPTNELFYF